MGVSALISECGKYRYWLKRKSELVHPEKDAALFVMLNPSTADSELDDPTIRRCKGFAKSWGCNGLVVANLYAYRATKPTELWTTEDNIGPDNNEWLQMLAVEYDDIVCAWGANAKPERVKEFCLIAKSAGARLWCLGMTKNGSPRHPLYIKADQPLIEFNGQTQ